VFLRFAKRFESLKNFFYSIVLKLLLLHKTKINYTDRYSNLLSKSKQQVQLW